MTWTTGLQQKRLEDQGEKTLIQRHVGIYMGMGAKGKNLCNLYQCLSQGITHGNSTKKVQNNRVFKMTWLIYMSKPFVSGHPTVAIVDT